MALSESQREAISAEAKRRGVDEAKLLSEAERLSGSGDAPAAKDAKPGKPAPGAEKPNLFMYLLPFVTVNEVRTIWLELDAVAGGEMNAAKYAAEQIAGTQAPKPDAPTE